MTFPYKLMMCFNERDGLLRRWKWQAHAGTHCHRGVPGGSDLTLVSFVCRELNGKLGMKNGNRAREKASVLTPVPREGLMVAYCALKTAG